MSLRTRWLVGASAIALFVATPAFATTTTGVLDTTFNGTGKVGIGRAWTTTLIAPAPNNGIYLALESRRDGDQPVHISRLLSNGKSDPTFGSAGHVDVDLGNGGLVAAAAIVHDGSGILVLLNNMTKYFTFGVVRVAGNGHVDPTFSGDGRVVFSYPFGNDSESIVTGHVLPDGRIELVLIKEGLFLPHAGQFFLVRLRPDGSPDPTLGPYGIKQLASWSNAGGDAMRPEAAFTSNGKVYVTVPTGTGSTMLERHTTTGALDTNFNGSGRRAYTCPSGQQTSDGPHVRVDSKGRPMLFCTPNGSDSFDMARLTATGAADTSFGGTGHVRVAGGGRYGIDPGNRVVIASVPDSGNSTTVNVRRYTSAGKVDTSFGTAGTATLTFGGTYELDTSPAFGSNRVYLSLFPNLSDIEIVFAITA